DDGNSTPTLDLAPGATTIGTVLYPFTIPLAVSDKDANDVEILRISGAPPGMGGTPRTGYGNHFAASIAGTPQTDPPYDHQYSAVIDLFDCNAVWADRSAPNATVADLQNAVMAGNCYHHVTKAVTITIANIPPTFTAAIPNQYDNAGAAIAALT